MKKRVRTFRLKKKRKKKDNKDFSWSKTPHRIPHRIPLPSFKS